MLVNVRIAGPLLDQTVMYRDIDVEASDVRQALAAACKTFPSLAMVVFSETGEVRDLVSIFLNTEDIRTLSMLGTAVHKGDIIYVLPSTAG